MYDVVIWLTALVLLAAIWMGGTWLIDRTDRTEESSSRTMIDDQSNETP